MSDSPKRGLWLPSTSAPAGLELRDGTARVVAYQRDGWFYLEDVAGSPGDGDQAYVPYRTTAEVEIELTLLGVPFRTLECPRCNSLANWPWPASNHHEGALDCALAPGHEMFGVLHIASTGHRWTMTDYGHVSMVAPLPVSP